MGFLIIGHVLAAMVWVGGMYFAYTALRPSSNELLEPPIRLALWEATLKRFFASVGGAIVLLLVTGYGLIGMQGGMAAVGIHVHIMQGLGLFMMALFGHLLFVPFKRMRRALAAGDIPAAGKNMNSVRIIVATNLVLGIVVVAIGAGGRYF
jgi:uncharacterized membrane protein